jgi:hypothetical protein
MAEKVSHGSKRIFLPRSLYAASSLNEPLSPWNATNGVAMDSVFSRMKMK